MSEKITIFKQQLFKKNHMIFFLIFTIESSHSTLQADKSFEPLPIILSEISHLQYFRVQNSKREITQKASYDFFKKKSPNILLIILYQLTQVSSL